VHAQGGKTVDVTSGSQFLWDLMRAGDGGFVFRAGRYRIARRTKPLRRASLSHGEGGRAFSAGGSRSKIPVCSTRRVKSAIVFSLTTDGPASRGCRRQVAAGQDCEEMGCQIFPHLSDLIIGDLVPLTFAVLHVAMHCHFVPIDA
jgi:hypothetical protein